MSKSTGGSKNQAFKSEFSSKSKEAEVEAKQELDFLDQPMKLFGMDYFRVVYVSCTILVIMLLVVFFTIDDDRIKRLTIVQGSLSVFLIISMAWYHNKLDQKKKERLRKQKQF